MRRHRLVLLVFTLLGVALTWPMAAHLGTHVPGDGIDDPALAWNLWWAKHALVDQPQNPFSCDWQFWPIGINLAFYTLTLLNGALSIPLQAVLGLIPAYNLLLLYSFVLGAFGAYLLCLDRQGFRPGSRSGAYERLGVTFGALVGGVLYGFASAKFFYASLGQANIASSQWIPFAVLYILRASGQRGRWRHAALAALFVTLQAYAELTYASFLAIFLVASAVWVGLRCILGRWPLQLVKGIVLRLALIGLLVLAGLAPFVANMLPDLRAEGDFFGQGGGFADVFSADLAGFALPTQLNPLFGGLIREVADSSAAAGRSLPIDKGQHIYLGYTVLALAGLGVWRRRKARSTWFWLSLTALFFVLTLGPSLRVAGHDLGLSLPFAWIASLPFFSGNRYPSRYVVMLLVSIAPLVSAGAAYFVSGLAALRKGRQWGWVGGGAILLALLAEHLSLPLPMSDLRVPELYRTVAAAPGDFALLELPLGWRNGARVAGKQDLVIMRQLWYQTAHGKRLLGGNTSRNPEFKFQYFSEDPTLALLIAASDAADLQQHTALREQLAATPITAETRRRAAEWASTLNLGFIMVHRDALGPGVETLARDLLPLSLVAEDGALALYRIDTDGTPPQAFDLGSDAHRLVLAEGWSPPTPGAGSDSPVYAQRSTVRLLLPLGEGATRLGLYGNALAADQTVTLLVDGKAAGNEPMGSEPGWLYFDLPPRSGAPPLSRVDLRFASLSAVADLSHGPWPVGQSGLAIATSILVRSAGEEVGDFAHIYVEGADVSPNQRGYNLAALDPDTGAMLDAMAFDTHADPAASRLLADWVSALEPGTPVAGSVRDEASTSLQPEALAALRALGVTGDLQGRFRWSHAFIGVVGAQPGAALELIDGIRPAQVSAGWLLSAPQVAAELTHLVLE